MEPVAADESLVEEMKEGSEQKTGRGIDKRKLYNGLSLYPGWSDIM